MRVKSCKDNYLMQVGDFVYDYRKDKGKELVVVAMSNNLAHYAVYNFGQRGLSLEFTSMTDAEVKGHQDGLKRNFKQIIRVGRESLK